MPATFAHPAFALWARRLQLPPSALVCGAIAPDVGYLLPFWSPWTGHTVLAVHTFALPVGLVLLALFHGLAEAAVIDLLPGGVRERVRPYAGRFRCGPGPVRWLQIGVAVWLGAATHVFVDALTHANGQIVVLWPAVFRRQDPVTGLFVHQVLQFGLTVVGTAALAIGSWRWFRRQPAPIRSAPRRLRVSWWMVSLVVGAGATVWALSQARGVGWQWWHWLAVQGAASGLVLVALALLALGLVHRLRSVIRSGPWAQDI